MYKGKIYNVLIALSNANGTTRHELTGVQYLSDCDGYIAFKQTDNTMCFFNKSKITYMFCTPVEEVVK